MYFYDVKIQTNIKQNLVEKYAEESGIFKNIFFFEIFFWTGLDPTHSFWAGPDKSSPVNSGALSTVHMQHEQWIATGEEAREGN